MILFTVICIFNFKSLVYKIYPKCLCRNELNGVLTGSRIITSTVVVYNVNKSVAGTAIT